jgi:hypothetical protein
MNWELLIDIIGWSGAALLLVAYALLSARRLEGHSVSYQVMNIQGSLCLLANAAYHRALPSAFVNLVWVFIACCALIYSIKSRPRIPPALENTAISQTEPGETDRL